LIRPLKLAAVVIAAVAAAAVPVVTDATGTINIQHKSGTANSYRDVEIKIFSGSLFLTTEDGHGTIVVTRAACSYQREIIVCLPTTAALVQDGASNALALKSGTIYLNYTGVAQPLSRSSAKLPPNSVMVALTTNNGTFIDVRGRIDELVKQ
jgi:hypothetical protein